MPLFRVEAHKEVIGLHFDPAHFVAHVDPPFLFEELGSIELCPIIGHVVKHVEEDGLRKGANARLRQSLWFAHVVALRDANVHLEAVAIVSFRIPLLTRCTQRANWLSESRVGRSWCNSIGRKCRTHSLLCHQAASVHLVVC